MMAPPHPTSVPAKKLNKFALGSLLISSYSILTYDATKPVNLNQYFNNEPRTKAGKEIFTFHTMQSRTMSCFYY